MPTDAITIDNYDVRFHERYASDQARLDHKFITDASFVPTHVESARSRSNVFSKWIELFELHLMTHPWALFAPPPEDHLMRNRFFFYALSPQFNWFDENAQDEEQEQEEKKQIEEYKKKIFAKKSKMIPTALIEKDRTALINLIDQVHVLNGLLRDVNARKMQYQKG